MVLEDSKLQPGCILLGVDGCYCKLGNVMEDRGSGMLGEALARKQRTPSFFCNCPLQDGVMCSERASQELPAAGCY
jgi:hypothetical protein